MLPKKDLTRISPKLREKYYGEEEDFALKGSKTNAPLGSESEELEKPHK